jgi:hypothetical protein
MEQTQLWEPFWHVSELLLLKMNLGHVRDCASQSFATKGVRKLYCGELLDEHSRILQHTATSETPVHPDDMLACAKLTARFVSHYQKTTERAPKRSSRY